MLSGTQLVLLAMYSTVNVVGPAGSHIELDHIPALICLLIAAAVMTFWQVYSMCTLPERKTFTGPKTTRMKRRLAMPGPRRAA